MTFTIDVIIGAADLENPERMRLHRESLDAGAKEHSKRSKFVKEEIRPYIRRIRTAMDQAARDLPETNETRLYRILSRHYTA